LRACRLQWQNVIQTRKLGLDMNTFASAALDSGPLPLIHRRYNTIATSPRGRLCARADGDGTLHLQFHPRGARSARFSIAQWRAGPLRTCHLILEALHQGLALLGEKPSRERSLQLSRLIDAPLSRRLNQYVLLNEGHYARLTEEVHLAADSCGRPAAALTLPLGWVAASVAGVAFEEPGAADEAAPPRAVRETFVLVRRQKRWELWARIEHANSGSMPSRRYECLSGTCLLQEEPALAAELLLYATLARSGRGAVQLSACFSGLIVPERLRLIEQRLSLESRTPH